MECAALNDDLAIRQAKKGRQTITTIYHFSHSHQLTRCKIDRILQAAIKVPACVACRQDMYGLVYACLDCLDFPFILHESCLKDMPMEVLESTFHPQHPLLSHQLNEMTRGETCNTCKEEMDCIIFACFDCGVSQHYSCAKYQTRKIKHNCHDHHLLHFGKSIFVKTSPQCNACGEDCSGTLFSCIDCAFHTHLECIPLPNIVEHRHHLHPLTLTNSVVEDNSGEYYCDMCETARNPEHDVYYCEECTYTAHIDCVISEVEPPEKIVEYLVPRPRKEGPQIRKQIDEDSDEEVVEE
ncbi:hypothetical protein PTKIN_Ptkin01aG0354000 [Pterospermum kingtungense]